MTDPQYEALSKKQRRRRARRVAVPARCLSLFALLVVVTASPCLAQSGGALRMQGAGLAIDVDSRWLDGGGYRPLKYSVAPLKTLKFDRTLTFQASLRHAWNDSERIQVKQDVVIPAGTTSNVAIEFFFSAPTNLPWVSAQVIVLENGEILKNLSHGINSNWNYSEQTEEAFLRLLYVGLNVPDTSAVARAVRVAQYYQSMGRPNAAPGRVALPTAIAKPVAALPERWIDYTCADVVAISLEEAKVLNREHPKKWAAIRDWTRSGGTLLVSSVGADFRGRSDLENLLDLSAAVVADGKSGWFGPDETTWGKPARGLGAANTDPTAPFQGRPTMPTPGVREPYHDEAGNYLDETEEIEGDQLSKFLDDLPEMPDKAPFMLHPCGMGTVAAWSGSPFNADPAVWAWFLNTLTVERHHWTQRHGLSCYDTNDEFYQFLVEGVGRAPVNAFRILITLFVLAIGPINYYLLRRYRRLHFLIVTVPLSAAGVTLLLFGYALIADGIGVRVRARSVTQIDQRSGRAECWARLSYHAGVAPGGGMVFSDDVAVLPINPAPFDDSQASKTLVWNEGQQRMPAGWLRSRTPMQLLTLRSRETNARLEIASDCSGGLKLANHLGVGIERVLVCDEEGALHLAEELDNGNEASAEPVSGRSVLEGFGVALNRSPPEYPPGIHVDQMYFSGRVFFRPTNVRMPVSMTTNCMNRRIAEWKRMLATGKGIPRRSYIAIVEDSPEVEYGVKRYSLEPSLHVVIGYW
jgi:hypothetical protein